MEGHHKSLAPLKEMSHVFCQYVASKVLFQRSRWKWAKVDKTSWWESLVSLRTRKKAVWWVVGHFPSHSVVEIPNIRGASRLIIFSVFRLHGNPIWIEYRISRHALWQWQIGGPCVVVRELECSCVFAASWNWARRATEGQECFLKEVRKDKREGANLSGCLSVIKMKQI